MKKTKEELRQEYEAGKVKLAQYRHKNQQLENRINYYEKGERQKRTHRLITRGAAVESIAPEVKGMSEVEFYSLMERVFSLPEVSVIVRSAVCKEGQ